ncbi:hypothetical protein ACFE04_012903 [Oxalis oulophora]
MRLLSLRSMRMKMLRTEMSKREKARLEEMQRLKKQKLYEILDSQNVAIDADMNPKGKGGFSSRQSCLLIVLKGSNTSKLTEEEEDGLAGETRNTRLLTQPSCKFRFTTSLCGCV